MGLAWRHQLAVSAGLAFALTTDIQLDAGAKIGLTAAAEDLVLFTGISLRF